MDENQLSAQEIAERRDSAIRRALNTPPKPTKEIVGKTERAQDRIRKARQAKPKSP